jgi:large subunit ribosomal protein L9
MEVILLERIEKVGKLGDVVKVKDGFARNYLLPQNKALRANKENLSVYEKEKEKYEKLNKDKLVAAEKIAKNMDDVSINIIKQASDSGQLYGSVSTRDIADELNKEGYKIEKKQIVLKSVIKTVGEHEVRIVIHPEHIINIMVNIGRTLEELTIKSDQIENISESNDSIEELQIIQIQKNLRK